jgi:hypothetical protein
MNNYVRGRGQGESGYRVLNSTGFDKAVVANNIIRGTISGTPYDIPASATGIVVKDNIGP